MKPFGSDNMIYLDYSATTPVVPEVLETFCKTTKNYIGNPNSLHKLGMESRHLMDTATQQVADLFGVKKEEIIFTSSASEANNTALLGVVESYPKRNKKIVTTKLEHSSVLETVSYLEKKGYEVGYVKILKNGQVDLDDLQRLLKEDPVLVSIGWINSEVGIIQDMKAITNLVKQYPKTLLHVDGTQIVGKVPITLDGIDLFSCSAHKFFGLKGIGCLIKKEKVELEPLIHGGKSQTIYRSGTPALALIVSFAKALRLALTDLDQKYHYVQKLNQFLKEELKKHSYIVINSDDTCSPYIISISIPNIKPETMLHALDEKEVYISTKTACAKDTSRSLTLETLQKAKEITTSSLRISLSYITTEEELQQFLKILKECYHALNLRKEEY